MKKFTILALILTIFTALPAFAQFKSRGERAEKKSKLQEVNFEEMTMKGTIRNPEGAFLVQKKGLKFYPLYDIQKDMDAKIRSSEPDEILNTSTNAKRSR